MKIAGRKSALTALPPPPRTWRFVLLTVLRLRVLVLLFVALCYFLLVYFSSFIIRITSLVGEKKLILVLFV